MRDAHDPRVDPVVEICGIRAPFRGEREPGWEYVPAVLKEHGQSCQQYALGEDPLGDLPRMAPGRCWANALQTSCSRGLRYVEGLTLSGSGWIWHAWNLDGIDHVIDRTLWEPGTAYCGVAMSPGRAARLSMLDGRDPGGPVLLWTHRRGIRATDEEAMARVRAWEALWPEVEAAERTGWGSGLEDRHSSGGQR